MAISRSGFYSNINLRYEIIHQLQKRETVFIPIDVETKKAKSPMRWLNCQCLKFLDLNYNRYGFFENDMNLYHSLATYTQLPMFSWNWRVKSQEQNIWLTEFEKYIEAYDLLVETDSDDLNLSVGDAKKIKAFFDLYKIRYSNKFSGSKGCHFIVQYCDFKHLPIRIYDESLHNIVKKYRDFSTFMRSILPLGVESMSQKVDLVLLFKILILRMNLLLGCETIDTSIADIKRICKVAYSYDCKSGLVAYPMTDAMLDNFDKSFYTPENILKQNNYKRGLLCNNADVPLDIRQAGVTKMLQDLEIFK